MYYFIVNVAGGSGTAARNWSELKAILKNEQVEYKAYRTRSTGDAGEIAHRLVDEIWKKKRQGDEKINLVVIGGDGTINEVLNGVKHLSDVKLGIIPSGSGNDFARGLGISKDVKEAWERIKADDSKSIDIGEVIVRDAIADVEAQDIFHRFGISAGIGLDAIVCKKVSSTTLKSFLNKIGIGQLSYILVTIKSLFTMKTSDMRIVIKNDADPNVRNLKRGIFLAAMNMPAEGGGVKMSPDAKVNDGKLSVCAAFNISKPKALSLLPLLSAGKHVGMDEFFNADGSEITITLKSPMTLHADGEYLGEHTQVTFRIFREELEVM
ncbi:MAG: YegS/Rv2252/BmrU family lipid kinase [Eubacterium sp.]|nr:YegS/Rv2252/BmrU family lipid kinase [Eubacterium sp.]